MLLILSMDGNSLQDILDKHRDWVQSDGKNGARADLSGYDLAGAGDLLRGANLGNAVFARANLQGVSLEGTNFAEADLTGVDLRNARLVGATFREADLRNADLTGATGVVTPQFAGANVAGAKLPEVIAKFEGLGQVAKVAEFAQRLFLLVLLQSVYALLTIVSTKDAQLLTNGSSLVLPGVPTPVPTVAFYLIGPFVLLGFYAYFHLYLQAMWEACVELPAVFPDGRLLDEAAYPWLLTRLVRVRLGRWRGTDTPLGQLRRVIATLAAWGLVPLLMFSFWWSYLPRHDWGGTLLHLVLLTVACWAGLWLLTTATATLSGKRVALGLLPSRVRPGSIPRWTWQALPAVPAATLVISLFAIGRFPVASAGLEPWATADFRDEAVSTLPPGWTAEDKQLDLVKGAELPGRDLRHLRASRAVLARANLQKANLQKADLNEADLRGANLSGADLTNAVLSGAKLQGADLTQADLTNANLLGALLDQAHLVGAKLPRCQLTDATLIGAQLQSGNLADTQLQRANLTKAELNQANLRKASLEGAKLDNAKLIKADLQAAVLKGASLAGADLSLANLTEADLSEVKGLKQEQLDGAIKDRTRLPPGFK
jgi:uncharacterized protein YjbI with pentapeptide repeats